MFYFIIHKAGICEEKIPVQDYQKENYTGLVLINGLRIRSDKTTDGRVIGYSSKDDRINILERSENKEIIEEIKDYWYKIKSANRDVGWVFGGFLIVEEKIEEREGYVNAFTVNVREYFGPGNRIIEQINPKDSFKIVAKTDKKIQVDDDENYWYKIKLANGKTGWIYGSLLVVKDKNSN